jgi:paired amphipathic helix protein Sin3a
MNKRLTIYSHQNRFSSRPEIYKQFLEILQTYQRESKPIGDVYTQVTQLFNSAPDLLEDFKQFLPESAAHAKQQAAARQAEESAPMSNLRGDPNFTSGSVTSQTPNRDMKMPPLGQFNVKDSGKEGKKRRNGPGAPILGPSSVGPAGGVDTTRMVDPHAGRGQAMAAGSSNKVSFTAIFCFLSVWLLFCFSLQDARIFILWCSHSLNTSGW